MCPNAIVRFGLLAALTGATTAWSQAPATPPSRPNIVVILLDDVGFGQLGAFGGPYHTPNIDALANDGLRYTNFHTTALCSPTRAALLTGRNHHSVGMGVITEVAGTDPGYTGIIPARAGSLAAILQDAGYATYALGKWHQTPTQEVTVDGPFDRWPVRVGFDHFYGFMGGETNQWTPALWADKTPVEPPKTHGYHLTVDLADHAISWLDERRQSQQPFFLYFAPGAGHAPHHVPQAYIDRNRGRFDQGWDKLREATFTRQREMGIIAATARLPERDEQIKAWDSLSKDEQRLFARMQEVHAAFVEHTDHEIGRVVAALKASGQYANTLIVLTSDNGASGEGGLAGAANYIRWQNGVPETVAGNLAMLDKLGGPDTYNHYPAGWSQAGNTPFRYWKQITHEGGVHDPLIVVWPQQIADQGGLRPQFGHMVDLTPTLLAAVGIAPPKTLHGVAQMPMEGVSLLGTLASAAAATDKHVQYFEMLGNRGVWADGWKAVAFHGRYPWDITARPLPSFANDRWELYDLTQDPTETVDLALTYPDKLAQLQALFDREARAHQVYPLNDQGLAQRVAATQAQINGGRLVYEYAGTAVRIPEMVAPPLANRSFTISADVAVATGHAHGVIVAEGGKFAGYTLFLLDGELIYQHNFLGMATYTVRSHERVPAGKAQLRCDFHKTGEHQGTVELFINGKLVGSGAIAHTVPGAYSLTETLDIGSDTLTPVSTLYASPFTFAGRIATVRFTLHPDAGAAYLQPYAD